MKISLASLALVALAAPQVYADTWNCNGWWADGGLRRYSITFNGYCENRSGQCFLDAIRARWMPVHNWQAWKRKDGKWQADFTVTAGMAPSLNAAMEDVTGLWRGCWNGA